MPIPIDGGGKNSIEVIAGYFYKLAAELKKAWETVYSWPWPFNLLSWDFYWAWAWVDLAADNILEFSHGYFSVIGVLGDMWGMLRLDYWDLWFRNEWRKFQSNPIAYIVGSIGDVIHDFAILTTFPGRWILEQIQDHRPEIYAWISDFPKEFTRWAQLNHPWLYNLLFDKETLITDIIDKFSWEAAYFIRDPKNATKYLSSLWLDLPMGFWADPAEGIVVWVFEGLLKHWRRVINSVVTVGEKVITEIW